MKRKPARPTPIIRRPAAGASSLQGNPPVMAWSIVYSGGSGSGSGATIDAASASRTDVLAAIALASPGDTVVVPANAGVSWSGGITISGITLKGPGKDAGSPTNITAGTVNIVKHATALTRLIGFRFTGSDQHINIDGDWTDRAYVIDDCYFYADGSGGYWAYIACNGGLWSRCTMTSTANNTADQFKITLGPSGAAVNESVTSSATWGSLDTTGERNTYFEDCTWTNFTEVCVDFDDGARSVVRHCTMNDSSFVSHGGGTNESGTKNDTSVYGSWQLEFYDNSFIRANPNSNLNKWHWQRGGCVIFVDNYVEVASTQAYNDKSELKLAIGGPGNNGTPAYPIGYQIGQMSTSPDATPNYPCLIYGNTGPGTEVSSPYNTDGLITISGSTGTGNDNSTPSYYVQSGRDYMTSNTWGYAKYTYPHPLRPA